MDKGAYCCGVKNGKLLSLEITDERTAYPKGFKDLVGNLKLKNCLTGEAYDSEKIFELLGGRVDPPPRIKLHRDAKARLSPKGKAARQFHEFGYEKWKVKRDYGRRWMIKSFFSTAKRCFGEAVKVTSPQGMVQEVRRKKAIFLIRAKKIGRYYSILHNNP